jgi:hypothetical protein
MVLRTPKQSRRKTRRFMVSPPQVFTTYLLFFLGPCTCTLRINATDSLVDLHRTKRSTREGAHGLPAALSPLVTPSQPAVRTHVVCSGSLPVPLPTPSACSHPRWLWPRRHPIQQDLSQCPDMIGQPGCHRGCPGAPVLRGARPVGGQGQGLGLA